MLNDFGRIVRNLDVVVVIFPGGQGRNEADRVNEGLDLPNLGIIFGVELLSQLGVVLLDCGVQFGRRSTRRVNHSLEFFKRVGNVWPG